MDNNTPGVAYLLHFDKKYKHAGHYLGWTTKLEQRLRQHRSGNRTLCVLTSVITFQGIGWRLVRLWEGPRSVETKLKEYKNNRRLCPVCNTNIDYDRCQLKKYNKHNPDRTL